jgi:hypothetical protein
MWSCMNSALHKTNYAQTCIHKKEHEGQQQRFRMIVVGINGRKAGI